MNNKKYPPYETFHNKLRNCNFLEKEYLDYEKLISCSSTTESPPLKMKHSELPPNGAQEYSYLEEM